MITVTPDVFRLAQVFTISRGSRTEAQVLTVRITRDGVTGWGECVPYARYGETLELVTAQIEGVGPSDHAGGLASGFACGGGAECSGLCAVGSGGQAGGQAGVGTGGTGANRGRRLRPLPCRSTRQKTCGPQAAKHAHRPLLKIKLGTPDDMPRLEAVRAGAPKTRIIIDANEGWSAEVYAELAPHLVAMGVALVEQPLPAGADDMLAEIARPLPVCADEAAHDCASLAGLKGKYDVVNIKLDKTGGLTEGLALKQAALAEGYGLMVGCMVGSSLAMAPATLLAQGVAFTDLDGPLLLAEDRENPLVFDAQGVHPPSAKLWG